MAYAPQKTVLRRKTLAWSGRNRRLARLIDADRAEQAQANGEPAPKPTPGGRSN